MSRSNDPLDILTEANRKLEALVDANNAVMAAFHAQNPAALSEGFVKFVAASTAVHTTQARAVLNASEAAIRK